MYLGRIVELASSRDLNRIPLHPYTVALLSAIPVPDPVVESRRRRIILKGDVPSPVAPPSGCRFHTRCWLRERLGNPEVMRDRDPALRVLATGHEVACHFAEEVDGSAGAAPGDGQGSASTRDGSAARRRPSAAADETPGRRGDRPGDEPPGVPADASGRRAAPATSPSPGRGDRLDERAAILGA